MLLASLKSEVEEDMVKVSVLYPMQSDTKFDMPYYLHSHITRVQQLLGPRLKGVAVEEGISGMQPGSSASYAAMGHLLFESVADFQASFGPHANTIVGDIPTIRTRNPSSR